MSDQNYKELEQEYERTVLGLQHTIAQRERLKKLMELTVYATQAYPLAEASEIIDMILKSPAEYMQDVFAYIFSGCKRDGYFVEFGACDGLVVSNTLTLERRLGWGGILAEPSRLWKDKLPLNRKAAIDLRCIAGETGSRVKFFDSDRPGNSSSRETHTYLGSITASYEVDTISLMDLLAYHSAPRLIDYISIDTEGSEKEVLEKFDFEKYKFGFITVEEHEGIPIDKSVQFLLEDAGYELVIAREPERPISIQISGVDKFFVPVGHPATKWKSFI